METMHQRVAGLDVHKRDLGPDHFNRRCSDQQKNRLVKRLADLGHTVRIKPIAA